MSDPDSSPVPAAHANGHVDIDEANFPPPASNMIQVVDYDEHFNAQLNHFLADGGLTSLAFDYHVASILGAQSSGKSTLLNLLFGTRFQTMDEENGRYQVTQGVWLGLDSTSSTIVLDLEGTDSRERGEGAVNFERKIALFALALSEVLIVNLWAQDVGRYNAANMDLLKTVMELDLQLFYGSATTTDASESDGVPSARMHKTRLLFVLRDHVSSPIEKLCATLRSDVENIWATIQKPEAARGIPVTDLFDIDFFALPHKLLMQQQFEERGAELRRRFRSGEVFDASYQSGIAADGFSAYADNVWETIRANRELDIPSQKEMLAHVRCEQIAREAMDLFETTVAPAREGLVGDGVSSQSDTKPYTGLVVLLKEATDAATMAYANAACRYAKAIAQEKGKDLNNRIVASAKELLDAQMRIAADSVVADVRNALDKRDNSPEPWKGWAADRSRLQSSAEDAFDVASGADAIDQLAEDHVLAFIKTAVSASRRRLTASLHETMTKFNDDVSERARSSVVDTFAKSVRPRVVAVFEAGGIDVWGDITAKVGDAWREAAAATRRMFSTDGIGASDDNADADADAEKMVESDMKRRCLHEARQAIHDAVGSPSTVLMRMTKRFDDTFRFDERGVPRHFGPREDIEAIFVAARDNALGMLDALAKVQLGGDVTQGGGLLGSVSRGLDGEQGGENDDIDDTLLNDATRDDLRDQLKRQAGVVFMEAKRAQEAAKVTAKIPVWLVFLILFLGWNEFMMVLRSPLLLLLVVVVAPLVYVGYVVDAPTLLGPAVMNTLQPLVEQAKAVVREYTEPAPTPATAPGTVTVNATQTPHNATAPSSLPTQASVTPTALGDTGSSSTAVSESRTTEEDVLGGSYAKDKFA